MPSTDFSSSSSGTLLTAEQLALFDHLKFNDTTDQLEADRSVESILNSFKLGKQWSISGGGEQLYCRSTSTGFNNYPAWGSIKDQSILANQGIDGVIPPQIRTLADNVIFPEPLGTFDISGAVDFEQAVTTTSTASVFSVEVIVEEAIAADDWVAYEVFFGTDNTGTRIFLQHVTGTVFNPGDTLKIDFEQPIDRGNDRPIFAQLVKKIGSRDAPPTVMKVRRSLTSPTQAWFKLSQRSYIDTRIADRTYVHKMLLGQELGALFTAEVEFHADLPLASTATGQIWRVMKRTANYFSLGMTSRFLAGYYESDGTAWIMRPNAALPTYDVVQGDTWKTTNYRNFTPNDMVTIFRMSIHGLNEDPDSLFMGMGALGSTTTATGNTALGTSAGGSLTSGSDNLFFGFNAGLVATTANFNVGIGKSSMLKLTTGQNNVGLGEDTLRFVTVSARNVAIGGGALRNHTKPDTTAIGFNALTANVNGVRNTAIGLKSLVANLDSDDNTAVGYKTLFTNIAGSQNTAIGAETLRFNLADANTAIGFQAMFINTTGTRNTAIGFTALASNSTQDDNTALGYEALKFAIASGNTAVGARTLSGVGVNGSNNTAIGTSAMIAAVTGADNVAVGAEALAFLTSGARNVAIGRAAGRLGTVAKSNVAIGPFAQANNIIGDFNVAIGDNALTNATGNDNIAIGFEALKSLTIGAGSVAVGCSALWVNSSPEMVAVGFETLFGNTTGTLNTAIGYKALRANIMGNSNTAVGHKALALAVAGTNTAVGASALGGPLSGSDNVAVGAGALFSLSSGSQNIGIGREALGQGTVSKSNVAIGFFALGSNIIGDFNIAIGADALLNATGNDNVAIGFEAMKNVTTGVDNTAIGDDVGLNLTTGSRNILIGQGADIDVNGRNDHLNIGNMLFADLNVGRFGINVQVPVHTFHAKKVGVNELSLEAFASGTTDYSRITFKKSDTNIIDSHLDVDNGDILGAMEFWGSGAGAFRRGAEIRATARQTFGSASIGTALRFFAAKTGSAGMTEFLTVFGDRVGIGRSSPSTALDVSGTVTLRDFTILGSGNTAVKMKRVTGTTSSAQGGQTTIFTGITPSKVIAISAVVDFGSGGKIANGHTATSGFNFGVWHGTLGAEVRLHPTDSATILSKLVSVWITYIA